MATVAAEALELVKAVRAEGYEAELDTKKAAYVLYHRGQALLDNEGPLQIPIHMKDMRSRKNMVARLVRNNIIPFDPKKADQVSKAKRTRPADLDAQFKAATGTLSPKQPRKSPRRDGPTLARANILRARLAAAVNDISGVRVDLVRLAIQNAQEKGHEYVPSEGAAEMQLMSIFSGGTPQKARMEFWESCLDAIGAPRDVVPVSKVTPDMLIKSDTRGVRGGAARRQAVETEDERAERETRILLEIGVEPVNGGWKCLKCNNRASSLESAEEHYRRHHEESPCPVTGCQHTVSKAGLGSHLMYVHKLGKDLRPLDNSGEAKGSSDGSDYLPGEPLHVRALTLMCAGQADAGLLAQAVKIAKEIERLEMGR